MGDDIQEIKLAIIEINKKLDKLSGHIDFVESTYSVMRSPIEYVCSKLPGSGKPKRELPNITGKE